MARWSRGAHHEDLRFHSDAGSQSTSIRYGERLAEIGATSRSGPLAIRMTAPWPRRRTATTRPNSFGDRPGRGPWRTVEDLELATLGWVRWHNTQRLHGYLDDVPPVEFENAFYAVPNNGNLMVGIK